MKDFLNKIIEAGTKPANEGDYYSTAEDGTQLLYCGKCHTARQTQIKFFNGEKHVVPCICECRRAAKEAEAAALKKYEHNEYTRSMLSAARMSGLQLRGYEGMTFDVADERKAKAQMRTAKLYVEKWPEMKANNMGLIFYGNTGNGKTYTAAAIANALIAQGVPVLFTSMSRIIAALQALPFGSNVNDYIEGLNRYPLWVLDDFGAERDTSFALEKVYDIINARYTAKKPVIYTTNLTLEELQAPTEMRFQRIFDRVIENATPIRFTAESYRKANAEAKKEELRALLLKGE